MTTKTEIDWLALRTIYATRLYLVRMLKILNLSLREQKPSGTFDPESGAPLDLDLEAEMESRTYLLEDEYLSGLEKYLHSTVRWFEENVCCRTVH